MSQGKCSDNSKQAGLLLQSLTVYLSELSCADDAAMLNIHAQIEEICLNLTAHNLIVCRTLNYFTLLLLLLLLLLDVIKWQQYLHCYTQHKENNFKGNTTNTEYT
jgi:hypothetical protein